MEDIEALNIVTVSKFERVSRHVEDSASLVKQLLTSGKAYSIHGNVFFDTSKAVDFGKLSHQSARDLRLKQIDPAPGKKSGVDFLLWRSVIDDEEVKWQTEFGAGRPGWHIEDTAIAFSEFGGPYNLHGGATELIFPHHESELAQDEAISGQVPFVKIWMHTGLLYKGNEKMSKSLGNVVTIKQALKKYTPDEIRYHFLKHHYREQLNYDPKSMDRSKEEFTVVREASSLASKEGARKEPTDIAWMEFAQNMDDDLHTPKALALLVETSKAIVDTKDEKLGGVFWNMIETLGFNLF
ncbi:MAG: class I tRNA ligase family protein [Nitrososphaerota archaeon]|nr:class I tRNA ligase family protein [Nitrososphaerota archaeon]